MHLSATNECSPVAADGLWARALLLIQRDDFDSGQDKRFLEKQTHRKLGSIALRA